MAVTVRRDLVAFRVQPLDPCRISLCRAAQGEERAAYIGLIKNRLNAIHLAIECLTEGDGIGTPASGRPIRPFPKVTMPSVAPPPGTVLTLFDGQTLTNWRMAGRGTFHAIDGALQSVPSFDLGLLWCVIPMPKNYRLELDFFVRTFATNSGVFVRFRNPESTGYYNPAWSAVFIPSMPATPSGFEIQIDNTASPDGRLKHKTGAVYAVNYPNDPPDDAQLPPAVAGDSVNPQNAQVAPTDV